MMQKYKKKVQEWNNRVPLRGTDKKFDKKFGKGIDGWFVNAKWADDLVSQIGDVRTKKGKIPKLCISSVELSPEKQIKKMFNGAAKITNSTPRFKKLSKKELKRVKLMVESIKNGKKKIEGRKKRDKEALNVLFPKDTLQEIIAETRRE